MVSRGVVLASPDREHSVFLEATEIAGLQQAIDVMTQRPTAAGGSVDVTGLQRLRRALELTNTADPASSTGVAPIVLSAPERSALELLHEQARIRSNLPERIRTVCDTCGLETIINPAVAAADRAAREAARSNASKANRLESLVSAAGWFTVGDPVMGTLTFMSGRDTNKPQSSATPAATCSRCQGTSFDVAPLTYCQSCREPRDETILLICPNCQFDFRSRAPATESIWAAPADAADRFLLTAARADFTTRAADFENGLYPRQRDALLDMLTKDDRLIGLVRCRFPAQAFRSVAVLLTSRALLWARESVTSDVTSDRVEWSAVVRLRPTGLDGKDRSNRGYEIHTESGDVTGMMDFRGIGLSLDEQAHTFGLDGVYHLIAEFVAAANPEAVVEPLVDAPSTPIPPPALPPARIPPPALPPRQPAHSDPPAAPPNWLPDPWRQARLRWWDGARWTPFTR